MSTYKRNKSGGSQSEGGSNSASPASSVALSNPSSSHGINNNAPKYGTLVPNRIFVGGITGETTEADLTELFSQFGNVKATKIISDRAGVSKGYGFITFETEEEVKFLIKDGNNVLLKERKLNIAPAIKKQPPFSRSFDANSPPPTAPSIYFHNGMPYTFHNGMAFFTPTPHQPAIAALPPSADIYPSYGPTQNTPPAPYGTPLLLPAHPPVFMPQNFSYQPMPMSNGAVPPQFIYTSSGSNSSNPGSPMAATPDTPQLPAQHFYPQQYTAHEAYFPQQYFISYNYGGDYDAQEQQNANDMMQGAERPIMMANPAPRWATSPIAALPLAKRVISSKRQNGCSSNLGTVNSANSSRLARKSSGGQDRDRERECEGDVGGGGDAQAMVRIPSPSDVNAKMQSLSLSS